MCVRQQRKSYGIPETRLNQRFCTNEWRGPWSMLVAWFPLLTLPIVVIALIPNGSPRWHLMWILSIVVFYCFKWLSWRSSNLLKTSQTRRLAWWLAWPGMDASRFLLKRKLSGEHRPEIAEWASATGVLVLGLALFAAGVLCVNRQNNIAGAWCGMFGIVFMLHFGLFHLMSCTWRTAGIDATPIMNRPWSSTGLGEFWGRRWNLAFRDTANVALFKPVARQWGPYVAILTVFLFSGVIHDLVISIPAKCGYGLPTLYFFLQGVVVLIEHRFARSLQGLGRIASLAIVFLPMPILFHPPFLRQVIVPFLQCVGAAFKL